MLPSLNSFSPQGSQAAREGEAPPSTAAASSSGWQGHQGGVGVYWDQPLCSTQAGFRIRCFSSAMLLGCRLEIKYNKSNDCYCADMLCCAGLGVPWLTGEPSALSWNGDSHEMALGRTPKSIH